MSQTFLCKVSFELVRSLFLLLHSEISQFETSVESLIELLSSQAERIEKQKLLVSLVCLFGSPASHTRLFLLGNRDSKYCWKRNWKSEAKKPRSSSEHRSKENWVGPVFIRASRHSLFFISSFFLCFRITVQLDSILRAEQEQKGLIEILQKQD